MRGIATDHCARVASQIRSEKIFAILRGISREHAVETAMALNRGGISLLEVTFNHSSPSGIEDTLECINQISKFLPEHVVVGAGTVLSAEQVRSAAQAGARFMVSPHFDHDVVQQTKKLGLFSLPGALTPTEIVLAVKAGADMVKLFPGGLFGSGYIKALGAPLAGIPLIVVGGVNLDNITGFFAAGAAGVGLGSNLVSGEEANVGNYSAIERKAGAYVEMIRAAAS